MIPKSLIDLSNKLLDSSKPDEDQNLMVMHTLGNKLKMRMLGK